MAIRPTFVDRLAERGFVDQWGFLAFALGGAAVIIIGKVIPLPALVVALVAVLAIVVYAVIVHRSGTGRLRGDQAGDNCYYLGLIFTLTSLAYAIIFFDPSNTASVIVQDFGVALATTVFGLILRVFFQQSRVDLVETEDTARVELADAAGRLKAELSSAVVSMNDFSRQMRQSLGEVQTEVVESLRAQRAASDQMIRDAMAEANAALAEQASEAVGRAKRLNAATEKIVGSIERHVTVLSVVERGSEGAAADLSALREQAAASLSALSEHAAHSATLSTLQAELQTSGRELRDVMAELGAQVRSFDGAATRFDDLLAARVEAVRAAPEHLIKETQLGVERVLAELQTSLERTVAAQGTFAAQFASRAAESLATTERHNEALEAELARSRQNAAKVHSALVEMTESLVDRLEAQSTP